MILLHPCAAQSVERRILYIVFGERLIGLLEHSPDLMTLIGCHVRIVVDDVLEFVYHAAVRQEQKTVRHVELAVLFCLLAVEDIHERI